MKALSVRRFMHAEGMFIIFLKVDPLNRGHGHLVVCSSTKAVEQGTLCDAIVRDCIEASGCRRKMDYATCLAVFEFEDASAAEAMLCQSLPNIKMEKVQAYFWMVESLDTQHSGHCEPYRDCEKTAYLTYAMKMTAKQMADSGIGASATHLILLIT
jgi:hypothetical protein